ncbi:MAG: hypothetical protein H6586_02165 [Flavobacteriales bacterium]|nr:hypothetical protein [Flavobacteriales bacterium]
MEKPIIILFLLFIGLNGFGQDKEKLDSLLKESLNDKEISDYHIQVFNAGKLLKNEDDNVMLSITDSLFSKNNDRKYFYFILFTKSMNGSDGFYSEALANSSYNFINNNLGDFLNYFLNSEILTEKDFDNWVQCCYGEISIVYENDIRKGMDGLMEILMMYGEKVGKNENEILEKFCNQLNLVHENLTSKK